MHIDNLSRRLIDRYQHGMPLCSEPYRAMAEELGCEEAEVLACLESLNAAGGLSRIGPVFEHSRAGSSTLVALAVPTERLEAVAARINQYPEVNHNYLREHDYNLWFVLTGPDRSHIDRLLAEIEADTGLVPLDLPMETAFRIDLGFPIGAAT
jgi:DNA-binding Lrp family transcriptional regulator